MAGCECSKVEVQSPRERRTLVVALVLNATMFVVGIVAGAIAQSSGLLADALDMLADAAAYAIALWAVGRSATFKVGAARSSGVILMLLGAGVILDGARRAWFGSTPNPLIMMPVATVALCVNATVLYLLSRGKEEQEVHIRASFIFTRAYVVANLGVIASGLVIFLTGFRYLDPVAGAAIGTYVVKEAFEILGEAGEVGDNAGDMPPA